LRGADAADAAVGELQREDVVIEELIFIRLAVGMEKNLLAIRRPVEGMLVVIAGRELANLPAGHVGQEDVQAAVVVEVTVPFPKIGLVEIARDNNRTAGQRLFRTGQRMDKCDALPVRGPRDVFSGLRYGAVRAFHRMDGSRATAVGSSDGQPLRAVVSN